MIDMTADEMIESLTGFDEIAIAKHFGAEWTELTNTKPSTFNRSLVFVHLTREGRSAAAAKDEVMNMNLRAVKDYFAPDVDEVVPDSPDSESGKEGSQPE